MIPLLLPCRASCSLDIEACSRVMQRMGEARLQASKAILSYVVPSASDLIDQVKHGRGSYALKSYLYEVPCMDILHIVGSLALQVRERVVAGGLSSVDMDANGEEIEVLEMLGEGTFGKVRGFLGDIHSASLRGM